jgi:Protein of unknown function (DUF3987)/Bifunctional DNA primase/polymerase, N-terminal
MSEESTPMFSGPNSLGCLFTRHAAKQPGAETVDLTPTVSDGGAHGERQMTAAIPWHAATRTNEQSPPNLEVALALAARGLRVFPICEDDTNVDPDRLKQPVIPKWQIYATTNEKQIRLWWSKHNYGVAIKCGKQDNGRYLTVLDYDVKTNEKTGIKARGAEAFAAHEMLDLPVDGMRSDTPTGGWHLFYWSDKPVRNSASKIAKGCDVRGEGGYVVAPRSTIHGKPYVLRDGPIPDLPDWVHKLAETRRTNSSINPKEFLTEKDRPEQIAAAKDWLLNEAPEATEGAGGDAQTLQVAFDVRDFSISEETCFDLMAEFWNDTKAHPPWTAEDLRQKVSNAYAYARLPGGIKDPKGELPPVEIEGDIKATPALGDPVDLWAEEGDPPDLALGVLPPALERWTRDEARRLGITYGAAAVAAIVTTAAALSSGFRVQVKQHNTGHTEAPILWGAIVGQPGARKSPVLKAFMRPLEQIERENAVANQTSRKEYNQKHREWKQKTKKGETLPEPARPPQRRKIVQDITAEALALTLADNPDGLLCYSDELAQWAGNMDSYRPGKATSRDQPFWLSAKNGSPYTVDRVTRDPVSVPVNAVHVLGGIQPDVIRKLASGWGGNGMMPRFLLANMPRAAIAPDVEPDATAQKAMDDAIRLINSLKPTDFFDTFKFSPEADLVRREVVSFADTM